MGFYVDSKNKTCARKKAQRIKPKNKVITSVGKTRHDGKFYITTRFKR